MSSLLTDGLNCGLHYTDCKQNGVIRFQIINLSFTGRKWAVFDAKVAAFFCRKLMAFCDKSGVLWSVKAGMTETYYLFLRLCCLILPEMWGRLWGGERAVRISRNNPAHVKKQTGQNMLWIMFCPVLLCFRFSYLPYRLQMPVRCCCRQGCLYGYAFRS